ncbi:MAG TPA: isoaspartyl peptidase/L-asparaginase [Rhodothermales bacterium]|nr:isoaspartyl peptidase/L-asparaginase [Rhodothermales bacterium]
MDTPGKFMLRGFARSAMLLVIMGMTGMGSSARAQPGVTGRTASDASPISIVIHGGAGSIRPGQMTPEQEQAYRDKLTEALKAGYSVLQQNRSSLDAVEAAIQVMEASPLFNAGVGAVLTNTGTVEMDASIMDGRTHQAGAVARIMHVKSPIALARLVMEDSPHVMMVGDGAEAFAKEHGIELVPNEYFQTDRRKRQLQQMQEEEEEKGATGMRFPENPEVGGMSKFGTVGAVALDRAGNLAAATSTGGMMNKRFGRVGDSPIIGAGTYADNETCGVSSTGYGEYFMRGVIAYDISAMMRYAGLPLAEAANAVIHGKLTQAGGTGGVIAMDRQGHIVTPFNTDGMFRAYIDTAGNTVVKMYRDEGE